MSYSHEVLVVSEPSMMGSEFGVDDERTISRVENTQFDQNSAGISHPSMMSSVINGSCRSRLDVKLLNLQIQNRQMTSAIRAWLIVLSYLFNKLIVYHTIANYLRF